MCDMNYNYTTSHFATDSLQVHRLSLLKTLANVYTNRLPDYT